MYRLVFTPATAGYRCHQEGCSAARTKGVESVLLITQTFETIAAAQAWADADEQEKGGETAAFKVCPCAKSQHG